MKDRILLFFALFAFLNLTSNASILSISENKNSLKISIVNDGNLSFSKKYIIATENTHILNIPIAWHSDEVPKLISNNEIDYKIYHAGLKNGIDIFNLEIDLSKEFSANFELKYPNNLNILYDNNNDVIVNFSYYNYLIEQNQPVLLSQNDWYDPTQTYLRIYTTKRKIYELSAGDINIPEFIGKDIRYFKMLKNGIEVPIYYADEDNNNSFSLSDKIYFVGDYARGDTTHYNFYTSRQAFYLYFDAETTGKRLELINQNQNSQNISTFFVDEHIEKQLIYNWNGLDEDYETRTIPYEELVWDLVIGDDNQRELSTIADYVYIPRPVDKIDFSYRYLMLDDTLRDFKPPIPPIYNIDYYFNSLNIGKIEVREVKEEFRIFELNSSNSFEGFNQFKIVSNEIQTQLPLDLRFTSALDYVKFSGEVYPYSIQDKISFSIPDRVLNSNIDIPDFLSERISYVDTSNEFIGFSSGESQISLKIGAVSSEENFVSISIDSYTHFSDKAGIYLTGWIDGTGYRTYHHQSFNSQMQQSINSFNSEYPISLVIVGINPNNEINSLISEFGGNPNEYSNNNEFIAVDFNENYLGESTKNFKSLSLELAVENINSSYKHNLLIPGGEDINILASGIEKVTELRKVNNVDLRNISENPELFIISIDPLVDLVEEEYESYRENKSNIEVKTINVEDIYDQFGNGIREPKSIKNFLNYSYYFNPESNLEYVFLIGDSYFNFVRDVNHIDSMNVIQPWGFPYSDYYYACLDSENDIIPELKVTRYTANTEKQLIDYLNKVKEYESAEPSAWMKRFMFLSGGLDESELSGFYSSRIGIFNEISGEPLQFDTLAIRKTNLSPGSEENASQIIGELNNGVSWTTFLGHAYAEGFDMDGWSASRLSNKGKYGILTTLSCNTGDFANPTVLNTRNESYTRAADRGFIATLGSTASGIANVQEWFLEEMLSVVTDTSKSYRNISDILYFAKRKYGSFSQGSWYHYTAFQFSMLGDPMLNLNISKDVDFYINQNELSILNENGTSEFLENNETAEITGFLRNLGICNSNDFTLALIRNYGSISDTFNIEYGKICNNTNFSFSVPVKDMAGVHNIQLIADVNNQTNDENRNNNTVSFRIEVFTTGLTQLDPMSNWNMYEDGTFRFINPLGDTENFIYEFKITDLDENTIISSTGSEINVESSHIDWKINTEQIPQNQTLKLYSKITNINNPNETSDWAGTYFSTVTENNNSKAEWEISNLQQFSQLEFENMTIDSENQVIKPGLETFDYELYGIRGDVNGSPPSIDWSFVNYGNEVITDNRFNQGFHILTVPVEMDGTNYTYRKFDTYDYNLPSIDSLNSYTFLNNSSARDMIEFLRDSVNENDYLLLMTTGSVFRLFSAANLNFPDSDLYNLDTLKAELNKFGSQKIDTVDGEMNIWMLDWDWGIAMRGRKGAKKGSIEEYAANTHDTMRIEGSLERFYPQGSFTTPVIGPAKRWEKFEITGLITDVLGTKIDVIGVDNEIEEVILTFENQKDIDLSSINTDEYNELKFRFSFQRNDYSGEGAIIPNDSYVESIRCIFEPVSELYVDNNMIDIEESVLRGEEVEFNYSIKNLSLRSNAENTTLRTQVAQQSGGGEVIIDTLELIEKNSTFNSDKMIGTAFLDNENQVIFSINHASDKVERFYFNNTASTSFSVTEDTIKPNLRVFANGEELKEGDWVEAQQEYVIELYDNSPLSINEENLLTARLNGRFHPSNTTVGYQYEFFENQELKARFTFTPEESEFEDILLEAFGSDASGNRDTVKILLRASLNRTDFSDMIFYPNPTEFDGNIEFNFINARNEGDAVVSIYDMTGRRIRQFIHRDLVVGRNRIYWDGLDNNQKQPPVGVYFYSVEIINTGFVDPKTDRFIIMK